MSKLVDLTGMKIGRWTVLKRDENKDKTLKNKSAYWVCQCECGRIESVNGSNLRKGGSLACKHCNRKSIPGIRKCKLEANPIARTDKGQTRAYKNWAAIKYRCNNPNSKPYKWYGARGIKMCEEWEKDFQAYYNYVSALDHFGEEGRSLDRIDNNGNYEPGNVRWATPTEQVHNKRFTKRKSRFATEEEKKAHKKEYMKEYYIRRKAKKEHLDQRIT